MVETKSDIASIVRKVNHGVYPEVFMAPEVRSSDDSFMSRLANPPKRAPLEIIVEELKKLFTIKIIETASYGSGNNYFNKVGHVIIDYETATQEDRRLWGLIKRSRHFPLTSLQEVAEKLAENPVIGTPFIQGRKYLIYDFPLGIYELKIPYEEKPRNTILFDRVVIKETQLKD